MEMRKKRIIHMAKGLGTKFSSKIFIHLGGISFSLVMIPKNNSHFHELITPFFFTAKSCYLTTRISLVPTFNSPRFFLYLPSLFTTNLFQPKDIYQESIHL